MNDSRLEGLQDFLDKSRDESDLQLYELLRDVNFKLSIVEAKVDDMVKRLGELEGRVDSLWNWRGRLRLGTERL